MTTVLFIEKLHSGFVLKVNNKKSAIKNEDDLASELTSIINKEVFQNQASRLVKSNRISLTIDTELNPDIAV